MPTPWPCEWMRLWRSSERKCWNWRKKSWRRGEDLGRFGKCLFVLSMFILFFSTRCFAGLFLFVMCCLFFFVCFVLFRTMGVSFG